METTFYRTFPGNKRKENGIGRKRTNFRHGGKDHTNGNGKSDKETEKKKTAGEDKEKNEKYGCLIT